MTIILSDYRENVLKVPHATESPTDAAQYMYRHGTKQYNLCGQFCVAYCMSDTAHTDSIDDFLNYWEARAVSWYRSLFKNGLARTTGLYDLGVMLSAYGVNAAPAKFSKTYTPKIFSDLLQEHRLILGVKIDHTGYLVGQGIPHWVVLESVTPLDDRHSIIDLYNPFTNAMEPYSWRELMTSTGAYKQGLWVPR